MSEAFEQANGFLSKKELHGGYQWLFRFPNDFGASVVRHEWSYGYAAGLFELAVLHFFGEDEKEFKLTYSTPITDDVLGRIDESEVLATLERIAALEAV